MILSDLSRRITASLARSLSMPVAATSSLSVIPLPLPSILRSNSASWDSVESTLKYAYFAASSASMKRTFPRQNLPNRIFPSRRICCHSSRLKFFTLLNTSISLPEVT